MTAAAQSDARRCFALDVVNRLRDAGYEALWAGGCVRDQLMGHAPKDYDVATGATPNEVINLFGQRHTVPVGVSFGVVMVIGPDKASGQVEVATFRADGEYLDGRRPATVEYCSAEEDAKRRDFTINGMFYDPLSAAVIDYVEGRQDLQRGVVRAIGDATARFTEDKLRMLRAVRFAATFDFELEGKTGDAIRRQADQIHQVSVERIAVELRRMLAHPKRAAAVRCLSDVGLLNELFAEAVPAERVAHVVSVLGQLQEQRFEPAFAYMLGTLQMQKTSSGAANVSIRDECRRLRLANVETECVCWLAEHQTLCREPRRLPLHKLKPLLANEWRDLLIDLIRAVAVGGGSAPEAAEFLQNYLSTTDVAMLNPPPLVHGGDLHALGLKPGPVFAELLQQVRNAQLDEEIADRSEGLEMLRQLADEALSSSQPNGQARPASE